MTRAALKLAAGALSMVCFLLAACAQSCASDPACSGGAQWIVAFSCSGVALGLAWLGLEVL